MGRGGGELPNRNIRYKTPGVATAKGETAAIFYQGRVFCCPRPRAPTAHAIRGAMMKNPASRSTPLLNPRACTSSKNKPFGHTHPHSDNAHGWVSPTSSTARALGPSKEHEARAARNKLGNRWSARPEHTAPKRRTWPEQHGSNNRTWSTNPLARANDSRGSGPSTERRRPASVWRPEQTTPEGAARAAP